ncbi:MAG: SDR family NAD(P)-dependent oxidoreductase, partial [Pseudomonadota bacterium]
MQRTQRKTAVVAGGSAGIGKAVGHKLALAGYNVVLLARNKKRVELAATELRNEGVDTLGLSCDVSDHRAVERAAKKAADRFGTIDVWVNSAMLTVFGPFEEMDDTEFRQVMDTTFMGQVNGTRAALSHMKPHGRGAIVNIGSGLSYRS